MTEDIKRVALHDGASVVNVVIVPLGWTSQASGAWQPPQGLTAVASSTAEIGWLVVDGQLVAPESVA